MPRRTLASFLARARLFIALVVVYLIVLQAIHVLSQVRTHRRLEADVADRARVAAAAVAGEIGSARLAAMLRAWRSRGARPGRLPLSRAFLRDRDVTAVELLTAAGWGMDSELRTTVEPEPTSRRAPLDEAARRRLARGEAVVKLESGLQGDPVYAAVTVLQPIVDADARVLGVLQVDVAAEELARSRRELRSHALVQGVSLLAFLALLVLFTRWLLRPVRLLEASASAGDEDVAEELARRDDTGFVIETYRQMIERLKGKERELRRLREVERHRADELQELNASIVDSMVSGVLIIDLSGGVRSMNDVAREILGVPEGPVMGRPFPEVLASVPELHDRLRRCVEEGLVLRRDEMRLSLPGAGRRDVGLTLSPLRDREGARTGALCLVMDLTEIKRLQEQVRLKESLASLGELSAGIAHEFRNSLATILGFSKLIQRNGEGDVLENAAAISEEVGALRKVVDDFLRFANPTRLVLEPIELGALFAELEGDVRTRAGDRRVDLGIGGELPTITGDETLLRRVFTNLLRNAVDAVGDPGRVEVTGELTDGEVTVHVDDDGPGIPEEERERVFVPFFTRKDKGTGLGLALARKVVVHHGGRVAVAESPLGGARFSVSLPLRQDRGDAPSVA